MNVTAVRTNDWKKDDGTVTKVTNVTFDDGQEVPGYDLPSEPEIGKPLPDGWEVATSARGKPYIKVPKPRGGGGAPQAAFRNTAAGQQAEQRSIHASVALQHAIARYPNADDEQLKAKVSFLFGILQELSSGGSAVSTPSQSSPQPTPPTSTASNEGGGGRAQNRARAEGGSVPPPGTQGKLGEGEPGSPGGVCAHPDNSPLKPDGSALPNGFSRCLACGVVHK